MDESAIGHDFSIKEVHDGHHFPERLHVGIPADLPALIKAPFWEQSKMDVRITCERAAVIRETSRELCRISGELRVRAHQLVERVRIEHARPATKPAQRNSTRRTPLQFLPNRGGRKVIGGRHLADRSGAENRLKSEERTSTIARASAVPESGIVCSISPEHHPRFRGRKLLKQGPE